MAGRRTRPLERDGREANAEEMVVEATPAIEDASPIGFHSPGEDQDDQPLDTLRNQLEAARFAQQMFHQSEIHKYEGIVQTLVDKINEMSQEDEGSGIRIQELERQRDTACLAMQHMNQVNLKMKHDYVEAMTRMDEQRHAQRHHDQSIAEELAQQLHRLRSAAATSFVQLEERAQGDGVTMAREYQRLAAVLHEQAEENLQLRAGISTSEHALVSMKERLQTTRDEETVAASDAHGVRLTAQYVQQGLRERLGEEEEFRSMAVRRMQDAEGQLRYYEVSAKHTLPTMHEELSELRTALRSQQELNARAKSELETARGLHHQGSQQASSMPISSRTTGSG